jgi:hypothetical protein
MRCFNDYRILSKSINIGMRLKEREMQIYYPEQKNFAPKVKAP